MPACLSLRPAALAATLAAAVAGGLVALPAPASAQVVGIGWGHGAPLPPRGVHIAQPPFFPHGRHHHVGPQVLPPGLAIAMLRRQGFREAGPLNLRGETIMVAAVEAGLGGGPVMVVMDAYDGEVLSVAPRRLAGAPSATGALPRQRMESSRLHGAPLPPARPKQVASAPAGAQAVPSAIRPALAYPPAEASALKNLTRPAQ